MTETLIAVPWARLVKDPELKVGDTSVGPLPVLGVPRLLTTGSPPSWNGVKPASASPMDSSELRHWDLPLPTSSGNHDQAKIRHPGVIHTVSLAGIPIRKKDEDRESCPRERWLQWQTQRYSDITDVDDFAVKGLELATKLGARREWSTVCEVWAGTGEERAEMSLIVSIAKDRSFNQAIRRISRNPRRMLLRQHAAIPISRIQEMDATTLRSYSQAPGRTAVQKAGPRQELLAVVRQDTTDLVENRLLLWTMNRIRHMATAYCDQNVKHHSSERFRQVRELLGLAQQVLKMPKLAKVRPLDQHPDSPTYCLQFDIYYRILWHNYFRIRRQEKVADDAWRWQARLWGTTVRVLIGSALIDIPGYGEVATSTPVFLKETTRGEWLAAHSIPGPFDTPFGTLHVVDLRSHDSAAYLSYLDVPDKSLLSGADILLVRPESKRVTFIWSLIGDPADHANAVNSLQNHLAQSTTEGDWTWTGWLVPATPEIAQTSVTHTTTGSLTTLTIPTPVDTNWEQLKHTIDKLLRHEHAH